MMMCAHHFMISQPALVQLKDCKKTKPGPDPDLSGLEIPRTGEDCNRGPVLGLS